MTPDQYQNFKDEIKSHIEDVIQLKVNGKIDTISKRLDAFIIRADPAVKIFENLTWFKKSILSLVLFLAALATAMSYLQSFFSKK